MAGNLFISYRRSRYAEVALVRDALQRQGATVWLDKTDVDPLEAFPEAIRDGMARSHAVLVWWSTDYAASSTCMQEFRLAWQWAHRCETGIARRLWILNPHEFGDHILAGDLAPRSYLSAPAPEALEAWAAARVSTLSDLVLAGTLGASQRFVPQVPWFGEPVRPARTIGRDNELLRLHSALFPVRVASTSSSIIAQLHGIAGIGKSVLAAHYADSFATAYPGGIWWLDLSSWNPDTMRIDEDAEQAWLTSLQRALQRRHLGLLEQLAFDGKHRLVAPTQAHARLARYLEGTAQPYLWVIDNLPKVTDRSLRERIVAFMRAPSTLGRTLVTTRDAQGLAAASLLQLAPMSSADGRSLVGRELSPARRKREAAGLEALVVEVGGHPLALTLLAENLRDNDTTRLLEQVRSAGALARVEQIQRNLEAELGSLAPSVTATFRLCIEPLRGDARSVLTLASLGAANAPITLSFLERAFGVLTGKRRDEDAFSSALRELERGSLLGRIGPERDCAALHPMLAAANLACLGRAPQAELHALATALLARFARLDLDDDGVYLALRADVPHAEKLARAPDFPLPPRDHVRLSIGLSRLQSGDGRPAEALKAARHALATAEEHLSPDDPDALRARLTLSCALSGTGRLTDAANLQEGLLEAVEQRSGPTRRLWLDAMDALAITRERQHRFDVAEQLRRRLLEAVDASSADANDFIGRRTATALAGTLYQQGRLDDARALYEAIFAREVDEAAEPDSDSVAAVSAMHNLAATLAEQGEFDRARRLLRRALDGAERLMGGSHAFTRTVRVAMAGVLWQRRESEAAIVQYRTAFDDALLALGPQHPETLNTQSRLIGALGAAGPQEAFADMAQQFFETVRPLLAAGHPETLEAVETLAEALFQQHRSLAHLLPLLEQVFEARRSDLGHRHLETLRALSNVALAVGQAGETSRAVALRYQALSMAEDIDRERSLPTEILNATLFLAQALEADGQTHESARVQADLRERLREIMLPAVRH